MFIGGLDCFEFVNKMFANNLDEFKWFNLLDGVFMLVEAADVLDALDGVLNLAVDLAEFNNWFLKLETGFL